MSEMRWMCRSRRYGDAPVAAPAFAAQHWSSACRGRGGAVASREKRGAGRSRREGNAPVAARASAAWRWPPPAVAGEGGRVASRERAVHSHRPLLWRHEGLARPVLGHHWIPHLRTVGQREGQGHWEGTECTKSYFIARYKPRTAKIQPGQWPGAFPRGENDNPRGQTPEGGQWRGVGGLVRASAPPRPDPGLGPVRLPPPCPPYQGLSGWGGTAPHRQ